MTKPNLKNKSDPELAEWQAEYTSRHKNDILADREWERRLIKESAKISSRQTGFWILVGTILGAVLTTILPPLLSGLSQSLQSKTEISFQRQTENGQESHKDEMVQKLTEANKNIEKAKQVSSQSPVINN